MASAFERAQQRVGRTLRDKYRLDSLLGVGGMAAVYVATHRNGHRVALKMLHPEITSDPDVRARFLREGHAANRVDHPGAVRVIDDDLAEDGSVFIVMELLDGETIASRWERAGRRLPPGEVVAIAVQLLEVLAVAHAKGIVHRDIKPDNLFLTSTGQLKILDFGIARLREGPHATATQTGHTIGTPAFMPPEQALGRSRQIDARTDVWAVGATMFALASGQYVHEAQTAGEMMVYAGSRPARPLASAAPGVPAAIAQVVDRALLFAQDARWPDADAMRRALVAASQATGAAFESTMMLPSGAATAPAALGPRLETAVARTPGGAGSSTTSGVASSRGGGIPGPPSPTRGPRIGAMIAVAFVVSAAVFAGGAVVVTRLHSSEGTRDTAPPTPASAASTPSPASTSTSTPTSTPTPTPTPTASAPSAPSPSPSPRPVPVRPQPPRPRPIDPYAP